MRGAARVCSRPEDAIGGTTPAELTEPEPRALALDLALYGGSAVVAAGVWALSGIPIHREWAVMAIGGYLAGILATMAIRNRVSSREARARARLLVAAAAFLVVGLLPLAVEETWRAHTAPGLHAQSEVIVVEEAARALLGGRDPYAADLRGGPLSARSLGITTHFPYLPAMLVFGLPRTVGGTAPWSDARTFFAAVALAAVGAALLRWPRQPGRRDTGLRTTQVLLILPVGALLMATSGDDLPVVALMVLSVVLLDGDAVAGAGLAAGIAAAMKQTAWPLLPFMAVATLASRGRRKAVRFSVAAVAPILVTVAPFVAWSPGAFLEDAIRFPLGLGAQASPAQAPTIGTVIVRAFPSAHEAVTAALLALIVCVGVLLLRWRRPRTAAAAAVRTGSALLVAIALAPAARPGYVVYPIALVGCGILLRRSWPASARGDLGAGPATKGGWEGEPAT
jgi:hypothetical protein